MPRSLIDLCYLVAAVMFVVGLKGLTHPRTAVRGNLLSAAALLLAGVVTLLDEQIVSFRLIPIGVLTGSVAGLALAALIRMEAMPQLVALFNGFGGGASTLVAGAYLQGPDATAGQCTADVLTATAASGLVGTVTLSGSLVAFAKLQELTFVQDVRFRGQQIVNLVLTAICLGLGIAVVVQPESAIAAYWTMVIVALALSVLTLIAIGGADMPVVIALLNSCSGLAAAGIGFVLNNNLLIIAGSLVGASGLILTRIMCMAMNRSLANVLFGTLQPSGDSTSTAEVYATVQSTTADEVAIMLDVARRVCVVPGYGMAVAQAQHAVRDLTSLLLSRDIQVQFGVHPVAGRMPGHMNVLLAEADIAYEQLLEMDEINRSIDQVDVALVLGANDVVNPVARTDPDSPIAGMPIIDVDRARAVVVIKRSLSPGFAGIPNPLFAAENTRMLYGDGRAAVTEIIRALQER